MTNENNHLHNPNEQPSPDTEQENDTENTGSSEQTEQIVQTGSITAARGRHVIHCLTIIGQVEGHYILPAQNKTTKYEHVIPALVAIEEDPRIEGLIIILNTVGGDVEAGLAIAELVAGMKTPTVSLVLGGGHSIGVPLACSARRSYIAPSATMTIHPVRMSGLVLGVPQTFSYFEKMQDRIVKFVSQNSGITADRFKELMMTTGELAMDVGTVLDGENAVREGLIDELGSLQDVIHCLYEMIDEQQAQQKDQNADETAENPQSEDRTASSGEEKDSGKADGHAQEPAPKAAADRNAGNGRTSAARTGKKSKSAKAPAEKSGTGKKTQTSGQPEKGRTRGKAPSPSETTENRQNFDSPQGMSPSPADLYADTQRGNVGLERTSSSVNAGSHADTQRDTVEIGRTSSSVNAGSHADTQRGTVEIGRTSSSMNAGSHVDTQRGSVSQDGVSSSPEPVAVLRQNVSETPDSYTSYWVGAKARALDDASEPFMPAAVSEALKSADAAQQTAFGHRNPDRHGNAFASHVPDSSAERRGVQNKADAVSEILTPKSEAHTQKYGNTASSLSAYGVKPAEQSTEQTQTDPRALSQEMLESATIHEIEPEIISDFEDWEG